MKVVVLSLPPFRPFSSPSPVAVQPAGSDSVTVPFDGPFFSAWPCAVTWNGVPAATSKRSLVSESSVPSGRPPGAGIEAPWNIAVVEVLVASNGTRLAICVNVLHGMMNGRSGGDGNAPKPCDRYSCAASHRMCHHGRPPFAADGVPIHTPNTSSVGSLLTNVDAQSEPDGPEPDAPPRKSRFTSHVSRCSSLS